ncbi:hypothetical protein ABTY96_03375 [Streptomyces sp. NPDC096057]|uniref:hypothetical protein n=1 Tax=Streptomyces sp. NPDC096057 TaxID=3155543 RepID=UPI00331CF726
MSAEVIVALVTAASVIGAAVITAIPAFASLRRHTVAEGAATREALEGIATTLHTRIDDVRDDIDGVREDVARVREWQAGHDAEHLLIGRPRPRGDA